MNPIVAGVRRGLVDPSHTAGKFATAVSKYPIADKKTPRATNPPRRPPLEATPKVATPPRTTGKLDTSRCATLEIAGIIGNITANATKETSPK